MGMLYSILHLTPQLTGARLGPAGTTPAHRLVVVMNHCVVDTATGVDPPLSEAAPLAPPVVGVPQMIGLVAPLQMAGLQERAEETALPATPLEPVFGAMAFTLLVLVTCVSKRNFLETLPTHPSSTLASISKNMMISPLKLLVPEYPNPSLLSRTPR